MIQKLEKTTNTLKIWLITCLIGTPFSYITVLKPELNISTNDFRIILFGLFLSLGLTLPLIIVIYKLYNWIVNLTLLVRLIFIIVLVLFFL